MSLYAKFLLWSAANIAVMALLVVWSAGGLK